jgi:hypothetical protein
MSAAQLVNFSSESHCSPPSSQASQRRRSTKRAVAVTPLSTPPRKRSGAQRNVGRCDDVDNRAVETRDAVTDVTTTSRTDLERTESAEKTEPAANHNNADLDGNDDDATVQLSEDDDDEFDDVVVTLRPPPPSLSPEPPDDSAVPMSSLPNRSAVTPLRSASQVERSISCGSSVRASPELAAGPSAEEALASLPVMSPEASPVRPASPVREARDVDRDSASLSETQDYFIGKREQRALSNVADSSAYADTSQWRAQWRPEAGVDDEFKVPLRTADNSDDEHAAPRRRALTAADAPSDLQPGAQHAWRRYQASVQPLNKQHEPAPQCHCGADAVKRIVKKNSLNFGREFWGCARSKQRCKFFEWGDAGRPWDEMSSDARREAYFENMKKTLACQIVLQPPEYKAENLNKHLTDILERMRSQYKAAGDQMRVLGYTKAINAIKRCRRRIVKRRGGAPALRRRRPHRDQNRRDHSHRPAAAGRPRRRLRGGPHERAVQQGVGRRAGDGAPLVRGRLPHARRPARAREPS